MGAMRVHEFARPYTGGGGPVAVLFCHGLTASPGTLRDWAQHVERAGYAVSVPRLPGHGTTWRELAVTGWEDWYACVEREFHRLRADHDAVFVAGMSMGGALALRIAEQQPDDVAGLVLVNPAVSGGPSVAIAGALRSFVRSWDGTGSDLALPGVTEHSYPRVPSAAVHSMSRMWADVRARLDLVYCPLLLFRSTVDHVIPGISSDIVLKQVSSEVIEEVVLPNSYHVATRDIDAPTLFADTVAFLQRHAGA